MDRKKFLKKSLLSSAGYIAGSKLMKFKNVKPKESTYNKLIDKVNFPKDQIGYNHIPNNEIRTMKTVLHKASTRGHADHGWLNSYHSFSFANYYNPERMSFGVLRVLNDDTVDAAKGFSTHPHDNMEIISIPLEGDLEHKDSMGNVAVIREGDVQVMSAGTGVFHSEFNRKQDQKVKFLQIWLFPNKKDVEPRYDQISLNSITNNKNELHQILSPHQNDQGVWIHQNAWFHLGELERGTKTSYTLNKKDNGVYAFVIDGKIEIEGQDLEKRDGFGLWDIEKIQVNAISDCKVLLMEVPMNV